MAKVKCSKDHQHQPIEGNMIPGMSRSEFSQYYTPQMVKMLLDGIKKQWDDHWIIDKFFAPGRGKQKAEAAAAQNASAAET